MKKGMSTGVLIAIILGAIVILIGIYFIYGGKGFWEQIDQFAGITKTGRLEGTTTSPGAPVLMPGTRKVAIAAIGDELNRCWNLALKEKETTTCLPVILPTGINAVTKEDLSAYLYGKSDLAAAGSLSDYWEDYEPKGNLEQGKTYQICAVYRMLRPNKLYIISDKKGC